MEGLKSGKQKRNPWLVRSIWIAVVGLFVVEMSAAVDYVEASITQHAGGGVDWLTAFGLVVLNIAEQSLWHAGKLMPIFQYLPLAALPFVLMAIGLAMSRRAAERTRAK